MSPFGEGSSYSKIGRLGEFLTQPLFPPPYLSETIEFVWIPLFKNKSFLQQKYVEEGLSAHEVATLCFSSKSSVLKHLRVHGIRVRELNPGVKKRRCVAFGQRLTNRRLRIHRVENEVLNKMKELRSKNMTYEAISQALNTLGIRTKTGKGQWHRKTVQALVARPT